MTPRETEIRKALAEAEREGGVGYFDMEPVEEWLREILRLLDEARKENEHLQRACATGWGEPVLIEILRKDLDEARRERDEARKRITELEAEITSIRECL